MSTARSCRASARSWVSFRGTRSAFIPTANISAAPDGAWGRSRSAKIKKVLDKRYGTLTLEPRKLAFIDRIVADSRDVALNHTAGLSLPQQVMMTIFSLSELMDVAKSYQKSCMEIVQRRAWALIEGLG